MGPWWSGRSWSLVPQVSSPVSPAEGWGMGARLGRAGQEGRNYRTDRRLGWAEAAVALTRQPRLIQDRSPPVPAGLGAERKQDHGGEDTACAVGTLCR